MNKGKFLALIGCIVLTLSLAGCVGRKAKEPEISEEQRIAQQAYYEEMNRVATAIAGNWKVNELIWKPFKENSIPGKVTAFKGSYVSFDKSYYFDSNIKISNPYVYIDEMSKEQFEEKYPVNPFMQDYIALYEMEAVPEKTLYSVG